MIFGSTVTDSEKRRCLWGQICKDKLSSPSPKHNVEVGIGGNPKGPSTQIVGFHGPTTFQNMDFGT